MAKKEQDGFFEARREPVFTAEEQIRSLQPPITQGEQDYFVALIDAEGKLIEHDIGNQYHAELEEHRAGARFLEEHHADTKLMRRSAEDEVAAREKEPRSLMKAALYSKAAIAAGAIEFLISWATLPPILGLPRDSVMGVAVSLAPVVCLFAVKEPIDRFLREAPRQAVHAFNAMLTAGVGWVVYTMALARTETFKLLEAVSRGDFDVEFSSEVIDQFLVALTVVLVIAAAAFLSHAFRLGAPYVAVAKARLHLARLQNAERDLEKQVAESKKEEVRLQRQVEEKPPLIREAWARKLRAMLEAKCRQASADQVLEAELGLKSRLNGDFAFA